MQPVGARLEPPAMAGHAVAAPIGVRPKVGAANRPIGMSSGCDIGTEPRVS